MKHIYRPVRFYATVFAATWTCWVPAILLENEVLQTVALVLILRDKEPYANPAEHRKNKAKWGGYLV